MVSGVQGVVATPNVLVNGGLPLPVRST